MTEDELIAALAQARNECDARGEALETAYSELRRWHDRAHSRNRPPDLNCTGCAIWPIIAHMAALMGFDPLERHDPPRNWKARI